MCYELEELYWARRAEQARKEMEKAKELKKQSGAAAPAKPASPDTKPEAREPVPA
jgi:hypothetical protein